MPPSKPFDPPKHPRITIEDEDGKLRLIDLFQTITNPSLPVVSAQAVSRIAFGSITTSYTQLLTLFYQANILQVINSLGSASDITIGVQIGGSGPVIDKWRLEGESFTLDLKAGKILLPPSTVFYIKYNVAPSTGSLRVSVL